MSERGISGPAISAESPFLLLGAGRGGTPLLAAALAGHSRLVMAMEYLGVSHLLGMGLAQSADLDVFATRTQAFRTGCLSEVRGHLGRIWGNKITTEQLFGLEDHNALHPPYADVLHRFFEETVPEFRIVFIVRDGRACVASKVRRTGQTWEQAAFRWHYCVRVLRAVRRLGRPMCTIRFEDLVTDAATALQAVSTYLGVQFQPALLQQTASESMLVEYRRDGFDAERAAVPEIPRHVEAFLRPDLDYCGYA